MNEIEIIFYRTFNRLYPNASVLLRSQVINGNYRFDFVFADYFIIEIDGHDFHKSKKQRFYDYKRERDIQSVGYIVIRFTASDVYRNPENCINEMIDIVRLWHPIILNYYAPSEDPNRIPMIEAKGILKEILARGSA